MYQKPPELELTAFITGSVDAMLSGLPTVLARLLQVDPACLA